MRGAGDRLKPVPAPLIRLIDRMAYIGPRLRELKIIPYIGHTYA